MKDQTNDDGTNEHNKKLIVLWKRKEGRKEEKILENLFSFDFFVFILEMEYSSFRSFFLKFASSSI